MSARVRVRRARARKSRKAKAAASQDWGGNAAGVNSSGALIQSRGGALVKYLGGIFPPRYLNTMRYCESWVDAAAGGFSDAVFRINSVYDPYFGAGGQGCYGCDEIQALYAHYQVHAGTITVAASIPSGTAATDVYVFAHEYPVVAGSSEVRGQPEARILHLTPGVVQSVKLRNSVRRFFPTASDWEMSAADNANPNVCAYWHIVMINSANAQNAVNLCVTIDYDTEWFQQKMFNDVDS